MVRDQTTTYGDTINLMVRVHFLSIGDATNVNGTGPLFSLRRYYNFQWHETTKLHSEIPRVIIVRDHSFQSAIQPISMVRDHHFPFVDTTTSNGTGTLNFVWIYHHVWWHVTIYFQVAIALRFMVRDLCYLFADTTELKSTGPLFSFVDITNFNGTAPLFSGIGYH